MSKRTAVLVAGISLSLFVGCSSSDDTGNSSSGNTSSSSSSGAASSSSSSSGSGNASSSSSSSSSGGATGGGGAVSCNSTQDHLCVSYSSTPSNSTPDSYCAILGDGNVPVPSCTSDDLFATCTFTVASAGVDEVFYYYNAGNFTANQVKTACDAQHGTVSMK